MQPALVLDACILMSGVLRPLLLKLADDQWFIPIWSDKIGHEWRRNAARLWSIDTERLEQEWLIMQQMHPKANMSSGVNLPLCWSSPELQYSDRKDWHVILTASQARETYPSVTVLTWNLKDFQKTELKRLGLSVTDPDRLLVQWWNIDATHLIKRINETVQELVSHGRRQPEPLTHFLKRERLFRFTRLYEASLD